MDRRRTPADLQRIKDEIRAHISDGVKVKQTMRCGHEDSVFKSVDPSQTDCWACGVGKDKRTQPK